ncbi:MAG TPA: TonB-dependent receptor [Terriglobales bacterium]|nr:TonB-dependent receptor [Terriglobales bacterium]
MKRFHAVILLLVLSALAAPLAGQVIKGSISGTVLDPQGAVIQGAQVKATQIETNQEFTTSTDAAGLFRLSLLPVGTYRVEITRTGFRKLVQNGVPVSVGQNTSMGNLAMNLGEVSETVEVTSAAPLVQTSEAQVSASFSGEQLGTFVGVQENQGLDNLALFVPGVVSGRDLGFSNVNGQVGGLAVNGLRGRSNDQQIDGQNNNDNSVGGPALFLSDPEFVEQYQIVTNNFGPEYGRNSGSVINLVTKSGTNQWHGSIFGTESNSALNSLSHTQKVYEGLTQLPRFNDVFAGGTAGGYLKKDKVFLFGGFDTDIVSGKNAFTSGGITPTPAGIAQAAACSGNAQSQAAISALTNFGPFGVGGGSPTAINTAVQTIPVLDANGIPTGATCDVEFGQVQRTLPTNSRSFNWLLKTDIVGKSDRISARYLFNKATFFNLDSFVTAASGYPVNQPALAQDVYIGDTHTFSSRQVNEFKVSFSRLNVEFGGNTIGNTVPNAGGLANALANITFNSPSLAGFGPATTAPQGRIVNTWQVQDNWTFTAGKHQLKAGANYTFQRSPNIFLPNLNGQWRFDDWSHFFANVPNRINLALGDSSLDFREHDLFVYFGDDYKVKKNLTLNLGLTWSYYGQPANLFHNLDTTRESGSNPFFDPALPLSVRTFPELPSVKSSFGPSIGFAYQPQIAKWLFGDNKTTLRGGYRLSYDPPYYNIYTNISSAAPQVLLQTLRGASAAVVPLLAVPTGPNNRTELAPFLVTGVADPRSFNQTTVSPDFGPDRVHSWTFGVQRELSPHAALEVRYVGNHGEHLFQSINANPFIADLAAAFPNLIPAGVTPCTTPVIPVAPGSVPGSPQPDLGRVNCGEGVVRERTNTGSSDYNGLQTEFRANNLWNQLTMRAAYTFSKTTDNASEIFGSAAAGGTTAFSQNPLDFTQAEHSLSGLDIPHNFTLTAYEQLPFMRSQQGVVGHILGGWAVSGTYQLASGQPYTPVQIALNGNDFTDLAFLGAFNVAGAENLRPFVGNPAAPVTAVGAFAGDVGATGVGITPNTLIDFSAFNGSGTVTPVTQDQVRFIVNGGIADSVFGTPFGNAGRNSLRTSKLNVANLSLYKTFKAGERASVQWHMTVLNFLNHSNYIGSENFASIDPFIDDAGLRAFNTGFGDPTVFSDSTLQTASQGRRSFRFGLKVIW